MTFQEKNSYSSSEGGLGVGVCATVCQLKGCVQLFKNSTKTRQQKTGLNSAMNDIDMLPGSYPHRNYMVCMVWNII